MHLSAHVQGCDLACPEIKIKCRCLEGTEFGNINQNNIKYFFPLNSVALYDFNMTVIDMCMFEVHPQIITLDANIQFSPAVWISGIQCGYIHKNTFFFFLHYTCTSKRNSNCC